jgi:hypothetical protein
MSEYREQFKKFTGLNKRNENNVGAYCLWLESQLTQLQSANDKLKERVEGAEKYWAYDSTKGSHNPRLLKGESSVRKAVRLHLAEKLHLSNSHPKKWR